MRLGGIHRHDIATLVELECFAIFSREIEEVGREPVHFAGSEALWVVLFRRWEEETLDIVSAQITRLRTYVYTLNS